MDNLWGAVPSDPRYRLRRKVVLEHLRHDSRHWDHTFQAHPLTLSARLPKVGLEEGEIDETNMANANVAPGGVQPATQKISDIIGSIVPTKVWNKISTIRELC